MEAVKELQEESDAQLASELRKIEEENEKEQQEALKYLRLQLSRKEASALKIEKDKLKKLHKSSLDKLARDQMELHERKLVEQRAALISSTKLEGEETIEHLKLALQEGIDHNIKELKDNMLRERQIKLDEIQCAYDALLKEQMNQITMSFEKETSEICKTAECTANDEVAKRKESLNKDLEAHRVCILSVCHHKQLSLFITDSVYCIF